jgi:isopenicillin N synthase-like dioxygenase
VAYFANPKLESVLEPVRLPDELARVAPGWESVDPNDPIFSRFGDNYLKIRLRAHPDVAEKHYADLR